MQQHVFDDSVCALSVLDNLFQIIAQSVCQLGDFHAGLSVALHLLQRFLQFIYQFGRHPREIVDEIERIFDFVRDSSGQLTE